MKIRPYTTRNSFERATVRQIIEGWAAGCDYRATQNRSLWSQDGQLWSYNLLIGYRSATGHVIVADYTASGGHYRSQTTSTHVNLAKRIVGDSKAIMTVDAWERSPLYNQLPF